ncbi:ATP-dependent DNA helicase RecG [Actinotalea sp.]|uniref:ATP-dependent DNA helicase RecG n=1 Tax=Actinotalea sp. TaxID=1872145 RepID=UPI002BC51CC6|nr:ATP-dependent DNA helicase RecG [Actinotalea sp.]HQY33783.1 ATP-dependent DNA helicase RecG [Actinotalea sp.]HRA49582.1 ATP-dependent DNA helicase RecG [Actinotalea sp.]
MTDPDRRRLREPLATVLGPRTAAPLAQLGLHTTGDLLRHYPRRYAEPGTMTDLSALVPGEHVTVMARVVQTTVREMRSRGGAILQATVSDGPHDLSLTFFAKRRGVLRLHEDKLRPGRVGLFTGTVGAYRGVLQLTHPDYQVVGVDVDDEAAAMVEASRPIPLYPASAAVPTWRIQRAVRTVLDPLLAEDLPDPLPPEVLARHGLRSLRESLREIHEPYTEAEHQRARHRLRFEEAVVLQAALARRRAEVAGQPATARVGALPGEPNLLAAFDARLPFVLTAGQREVGGQVSDDLARSRPMQRLLQGEVGSGKTVVALRAMLQVVDSGGQAALLAPTEVLAAQHLRTLRALLGPLAEDGMLGGAEHATRVALLTGSQGTAARRAALLDAASGRAGIVVGTHALLGEHVQFADLGLVVVDEQHRFGVEQRDALRGRAGITPHLLVMTATPIPRTVAMTLFGDLEVSTLAEVPAGRPGTTTHVVAADNAGWLARTWARVREEVDAGHRAYVVCARISPDDRVDARGTDDADLVAPDAVLDLGPQPTPRPPLRAVEEVAAELAGLPTLAGVRIGVLHGRLPAAEKDDVMARFASGEVPVLVSTTVVEVGVDVPEATVMVVLDADRFGLSQLHQLRGRVGRGTAPGLCLLVADAQAGSDAATRLSTLAATTDGFRLATVDLELRREGDVLGASQSGSTSSLRLLRVVRDADLIALAREEATALVAQDPTLARWPALADAIETWLDPGHEDFLERA